MTTIAIIVGSLSQSSLNRQVANFICTQFDASITTEEVMISDLPLYTQDLDQSTLPAYDRVHAQLGAADAVLIVSPEHNRSMPAALKNVIDIASRPFGKNVWAQKKVAVVTASPSTYGGVNEAGVPNDERTAKCLTQFTQTFSAWVKA